MDDIIKGLTIIWLTTQIVTKIIEALKQKPKAISFLPSKKGIALLLYHLAA